MNDNLNPEDERADAALQGRRKFFTRITLAVGAFAASILSVPLVVAMIDPPTRRTGRDWRDVGKVTEFKEGETKLVTFANASPYEWDTDMDHSAAYVRREATGEFKVFSVNCAHLGCPVRYVEASELFLCPCHGGVYYKDGSWAAGPPPRGLYTYPVRVRNGAVEIETSAIPITNMKS